MNNPLANAFYAPSTHQITASQTYKPSLNDPQMWLDSAKFFRAQTIPIMKSLMRAFTVAASKYSPPGGKGKKLGVLSIPRQKYYSLIINMQKEIKENKDPRKRKIKKEDYAWIKKGYKFKVMKNKYGQKLQLKGYAKNQIYAKHMARIPTRGLAKYSWGTLLNTFDQQMITQQYKTAQYTPDGVVGLYRTEFPPVFRTLVKRSPDIMKWSWGKIKSTPLNMYNANWTITGINKHTTRWAYDKIAVERGVQSALSQWRSMYSAMSKGCISHLRKYLDFKLDKIKLQYKLK